MRRFVSLFCAAFLAFSARAAEKIFAFADYTLDHAPQDFHAVTDGGGKPGEWKVLLDEAVPEIAPTSSYARSVAKRVVLAQVSRDPSARRLPLLVFDGETFGDLKFSSQFKLVGGALEQAAGLVFRYQNASNFFVVIASGESGTIQCTRVVDGKVMPPYKVEKQISKDVWHELFVQCDGTRITCGLDGAIAIKLVDNSASGIVGKIGFCTRADAVSYFAGGKVTFTPREGLAQKLVNGAVEEFSRVIGLKIFAFRPGETNPVVVASQDASGLGQSGGSAERDVIRTGHSFFGKGKETVTVMLPLRDRNGEPMAAVAVEMKSFPGQTQENALVRAQPIVRSMQGKAQSLRELLDLD